MHSLALLLRDEAGIERGGEDVVDQRFSVVPSDFFCIEIDTSGGFRPTTVKKLNGARFAIPAFESVLRGQSAQ